VKGGRREENCKRGDDGEDGERAETQTIDNHRRKAPVIDLVLLRFVSLYLTGQLPQLVKDVGQLVEDVGQLVEDSSSRMLESSVFDRDLSSCSSSPTAGIVWMLRHCDESFSSSTRDAFLRGADLMLPRRQSDVERRLASQSSRLLLLLPFVPISFARWWPPTTRVEYLEAMSSLRIDWRRINDARRCDVVTRSTSGSRRMRNSHANHSHTPTLT